MSEVAARPVRSGRLRWAALGVLSALALGALVAFAWPSPDPEAVWQRARAAFEARDFARVEAELARLGRLREPTSLDRMLHAQLAIARGRVDEAIADLDRIPDDHPMASQARLEIGQLELRQSRFVAAEAAPAGSL